MHSTVRHKCIFILYAKPGMGGGRYASFVGSDKVRCKCLIVSFPLEMGREAKGYSMGG